MGIRQVERFIWVMLAAASSVSLGATVGGISHGGEPAKIRADFCAAMAMPPEERVLVLQRLEKDIDNAVSAGALTGRAVLCKHSIRVQELNRWLADFRRAIDLAERRLKRDLRTTMLNIERWLDNPVGSAPRPDTELTALQTLTRFKRRFFTDHTWP